MDQSKIDSVEVPMDEPEIRAKLYHDKDGPMLELIIIGVDDRVVVVNMDIPAARKLKATLEALTGSQQY